MMNAERMDTATCVGTDAETHKVHTRVTVHLVSIPLKPGSTHVWVSCY